MNEEKITIWEERIHACQNSDLTVAAWCREHQISVATYYYWRKRVSANDEMLSVKEPVFVDLQKAAVPASVLSHSIATPSLVAHIMYQKFAMGIPLNRMEKDFYRMGLVLPRKNMANWVIRCNEDWFTPIYERIHESMIQKCENLHMDETRIQVNKELEKKASSDSFMWVLQSGASEKIKATLFHYSRTRSRKVAVDLLTGYHGYLTTDAYTAYENLNIDGIKNNFCWSHVRRYYVESIPLDSNGKELENSKGAEAREYIDLLFKLEDEMKDLSYEEKSVKWHPVPCLMPFGRGWMKQPQRRRQMKN